MKAKRIIQIMFFTTLCLQGCMLTKVVTVPLRVGGSVVSVVPVVGDVVDGTISTTADIVD